MRNTNIRVLVLRLEREGLLEGDCGDLIVGYCERNNMPDIIASNDEKDPGSIVPQLFEKIQSAVKSGASPVEYYLNIKEGIGFDSEKSILFHMCMLQLAMRLPPTEGSIKIGENIMAAIIDPLRYGTWWLNEIKKISVH